MISDIEMSLFQSVVDRRDQRAAETPESACIMLERTTPCSAGPPGSSSLLAWVCEGREDAKGKEIQPLREGLCLCHPCGLGLWKSLG